jgi:hypothetical protein
LAIRKGKNGQFPRSQTRREVAFPWPLVSALAKPVNNDEMPEIG